MSLGEEIRRMLEEMKRIEEEAYTMLRELLGLEELERPMWSTDGSLEPLFEVYDRGDHYLVVIDMPYADLGTLTITGKDNILWVKCKLRRHVRFERWGTLQHQREFKEYKKTIVLPEDADASDFKLLRKTESCILEIKVPKVARRGRYLA